MLVPTSRRVVDLVQVLIREGVSLRSSTIHLASWAEKHRGWCTPSAIKATTTPSMPFWATLTDTRLPVRSGGSGGPDLVGPFSACRGSRRGRLGGRRARGRRR